MGEFVPRTKTLRAESNLETPVETQADGAPLFRISDLSAGYDKKVVVEGVDLEVRAGDVVALIGPNGSGKSTILKTITRHLAPLAGAVELAEDAGDAAGAMHVGNLPLAGRRGLADARHGVGDTLDVIQCEVHVGGLRHGEDMQHGVGGTAHGHIHGHGVLESLLGGDGTRQHGIVGIVVVLVSDLDDLLGGTLEQVLAVGMGGQNGAVARQSQTDGLGQAVHGVGGEHAGAGTAGRADGLLVGEQILFVQIVIGGGVHHVDQIGVLLHGAVGQHGGAGLHRTAGNEHGRNVESQRGHQHARHDLVAVRDQDEAIEARSHRNGLDRIGDELAARERVLHARVAHGDAVADTDGGELKGRAACCCDAELRSLGDFAQVDVARDDLVEGIADADQRLLEVLRTVAICMEQGTMCTACSTFFDNIASHKQLSYLSVLCAHT